MQAYTHFGDDRILRLRAAILVYGSEHGGGEQFATVHPILDPGTGLPLERSAARGGSRAAARGDAGDAAEACPILGAGKAVTTGFLRSLTTAIGGHVAPEVLPASVLARTPSMLAWWTPPTQRLFFFTQRREDGGVDAEAEHVAEHAEAAAARRAARERARQDARARRALNGVRLPCPALVWKVVERQLYVRALTTAKRPEAETAVCCVPFFNTYADGAVCHGSMRAPDGAGVATMAAWEDAYFGSEFSHVAPGARLTSHPEGFWGLWLGCRTRQRFPTRFLVPAQQTLRDFLCGG